MFNLICHNVENEYFEFRFFIFPDSKYVPISNEKPDVNPEEYDVDLDGQENNDDVRESKHDTNETLTLNENAKNKTAIVVPDLSETISDKPSTVVAQTPNPKEVEHGSDYWHEMKQKLVIVSKCLSFKIPAL